MEQTTHQTVVEHTALETVHKRDEDGRIIDTYTVRMRWEDVVEEKRALAPTLRSGKLERAKARYRGQPLDDVEPRGWMLLNGEVFYAPARMPYDGLVAWARRELSAAGVTAGQSPISARAAKRATKRAKQTAGLPEVAC